MGELDGIWAVERVSGALPPLHGCVKRIHGSSGTTEFPNFPRMPFDVRGLELHYRGPFALLIDKLERRNGGYIGRATLLGHEFGQFELRKLGPWESPRGQATARLLPLRRICGRQVRGTVPCTRLRSTGPRDSPLHEAASWSEGQSLARGCSRQVRGLSPDLSS